jgi:hypothetical protein
MSLDHFTAAGRLSFPADTDIVTRVNRYAQARRMTIHEALQELVIAGLDRDAP